MSAALAAVDRSPFDLDDDDSYRRWREWKLAVRPQRVEDLRVEIADAFALTAAERNALLRTIARAGAALYCVGKAADDPALPRALGAQLGLHRLDANWLADEDGVSRIAISDAQDGEGRGGFIPYTDRAIRWHTDGYYQPAERRIRGMILHCVRPAHSGGETGLLDHELAYLALRDESPALVRALMASDAMTIPARLDGEGVARAAQSGPVFSLDDAGHLHMRYTARSRSIEWKDDAPTRAAVQRLAALLDGGSPWVLRATLAAGEGLVGHNLLHERSAFIDAPEAPRLLYRARYLDRVTSTEDGAWR